LYRQHFFFKFCGNVLYLFPIGCSYHNMIATRNTKVPKGKPKVIYKSSYKRFCQESFCTDINIVCSIWCL